MKRRIVLHKLTRYIYPLRHTTYECQNKPAVANIGFYLGRGQDQFRREDLKNGRVLEISRSFLGKTGLFYAENVIWSSYNSNFIRTFITMKM